MLQPEPDNQVVLSGALIELAALRHTPAGVPVQRFTLKHRSRQVEADQPRDVEVEAQCVALGRPATLISGTALASRVRIAGFLASRSARIATPVVHVTEIEFLEGNDNGF